MIYSASSSLPLLLLLNVVGDIREGCYLLLWAGLLHRPSRLRHHLKKMVRLLERLPRLTLRDSGMWCTMMSSSRTLEVRPAKIFPHGPESVQMVIIWQSSIHSHVHSHSPTHTLKTTNSKSQKLTKQDAFRFQCGGPHPRRLLPAPQGWPTSETFSLRQ